jgi:hypothetical protein
MATWAQNSPHRLVYNDALNVTVRTSFLTPAALLRADVIYGNAVLRRKFGLSQRLSAAATPFNLAKAGLARAARQMNWYPQKANSRAITFHVEPAAPNAVRDIAQAAA